MPVPALFYPLIPAMRYCVALLGAAALAVITHAAPEQAAPEFGKNVELAPFAVKGKPLSVSIHARSKSDRKYGEKFADEVVQVAYETMGDSTGKGLLIVGVDGEPHPINFFRRFIELAKAGKLDPGVAEAAVQVEGMIQKMQGIIKVKDEDGEDIGITFDTFVPALPMPLEGTASRLYQLAWAEKFDAARVEKMLTSLTPADLERPDLIRFGWVLYLPPQAATSRVMKEVLDKAMKKEKMGVFKRAAVKSAMFVFAPVIKKATEALRKGMLFRTILDAESSYSDDDLNELTKVYVGAMMPDLKPGSSGDRERVLAAIEKQKIANAEYAKDPFVTPTRLANYDPAAYAPFIGDYSNKPPEVTHRFKREGDSFQWNYRDEKPRTYYPAGDRLLVNEAGTVTIQFIVDEAGTVTGVEERWKRTRQTIPRKTSEAAPAKA